MEEGTSCERNRSAVMAVDAHEYSSNLFFVPDFSRSVFIFWNASFGWIDSYISRAGICRKGLRLFRSPFLNSFFSLFNKSSSPPLPSPSLSIFNKSSSAPLPPLSLSLFNKSSSPPSLSPLLIPSLFLSLRIPSGQELQQTGEHQLIGSTIRASNSTLLVVEAAKRAQILCGPVFHYPELTSKMLAESITRRKRIREKEEGVYLFSDSLSTPTSTAVATGILQNRMSYHNSETDALVRMHTKKLGLGLEEMRKRHCRALLSVLEQQTTKLLQEKDAELERIKLRNTEMVETVNRMAVDIQTWFNIASNNESIAANLRVTLDQVLKDTFGASGQADNAQSCCFEEEEMEGTAVEACEAEAVEKLRGWWSCKACCKRDLSVLLLPCRHLCLCTDCAPTMTTCPICHCVKNGSIQVFLF